MNESTGIREKDGQQLSLNYTYWTDLSLARDMALAIKTQLAEVGIDVTTTGQDQMTWWTEGVAGNYDITTWNTEINPKLQIDGILLTMVDSRTNFAKEISALLRETYGSKIKVFGTEIPHSVRAKEISAEGKSIFAHDPGGKVAEGYRNLTKEVLKLEKQREKNRAGLGR